MADNKYKLQFTLSNGETINAGEIVAPQGPKGDKGDKGDSADIPYSSSTPFMDGVGSVGSANTVARGDHRHPSDTSRQEKLVSGENIKTINGQSVLGSGDILISGGGTIDADTLNGLLSGSNGIAIAKNTAGDKVEIGISRSGFELGTFSTDRTGIEFVCSDTTQTINFISPDGDGLLICNMMDSTRSSIVLLGSSGEGTMIAYNGITYTPDSSSSEVKHYLREGNVKTLFGNKSIYGSGNIDLYKHNVIISQGSTESDRMCVYCQILSSKSANINSLTLFKAYIKDDNEFIPATGKLKLYSGDPGSIIGGVCKAGAIEYNTRGKYTNNIDFSSGWATINAAGSLTFYDTVTTV